MSLPVRKIIAITSILFGIYLVCFFGRVFPSILSGGLDNLIGILLYSIFTTSGILLIHSGYHLFKNQKIESRYAILYWTFSIPMFYSQYLWWHIVFFSLWNQPSLETFLNEFYHYIPTACFFLFAAILLVYHGWIVIKKE